MALSNVIPAILIAPKWYRLLDFNNNLLQTVILNRLISVSTICTPEFFIASHFNTHHTLL